MLWISPQVDWFWQSKLLCNGLIWIQLHKKWGETETDGATKKQKRKRWNSGDKAWSRSDGAVEVI